MDIFVVLNQMIQLFLLLGLGYFLYKVKIIDTPMTKKLTTLVLSVSCPAMVINAVLNITEYQPLSVVIYVIVIAAIIFSIMPVAGYGIAKLLRIPPDQVGTYVFMTEFSNIGFIGFPIMNAIFGSEAVFYTSLFNLLFNLFVFTLGVYLITMGKGKKQPFRLQSLLTPGVISCVIALVFYLGHIHLPLVLSNTINTVSQMNTPLAMMVIGATLGEIPVKKIFNEYLLYPYTILKQVLLPIITYYICILLINDPVILGVTVINVAMPVGTSVVLFAKLYGGDADLGAKSIFLTTLFSVATIPLIVYFFLM